jgi:hypothetical protein
MKGIPYESARFVARLNREVAFPDKRMKMISIPYTLNL